MKKEQYYMNRNLNSCLEPTHMNLAVLAGLENNIHLTGYSDRLINVALGM